MRSPILVVFAIHFLGFPVTPYSRNSRQSGCLDVAIVGAGIGGTYTAWRLRDRGLKIGIFENTDRIGGRMFSVFLPTASGVPIDLGAMRYEPENHKTLVGLLEELRLKSTVFKGDSFEKTYYFRGKHLKFADLLTDNLPYNLRPGEPKDPDQLLWKLYQSAMNNTEPDKISNVEEGITKDGIPLYKHGYLDLMGTLWSREAKQYLQDFIAFQSDFENNNAVHNTPADRLSTGDVTTTIKTVTGGMNVISKRLGLLFLKASKQHSIRLNQRVISIRRKTQRGKVWYELTIVSTRTVNGVTVDSKARQKKTCAKEVILACPRTALSRIKWGPLRNDPVVLHALDSVSDNSAMKLFLVYPSTWWDRLNGTSKSIVSDLPLRQTMEYGRYRNSLGHENVVVLVSYIDDETEIDYWTQLRKHPGTISSSAVPAAYAVSRKVVEHAHHHLGKLYDVSPRDIPQPLDGVMQIWRGGAYGNAWELFKPGFKPSAVQVFMRRPSSIDRVFIVSNSFSMGLTFWSEGTLREADAVISQFSQK
ncbi:aplysianin-A-like [Liolophura sinensis]|uniref:aplysianin-A-like n=1 Tax=Liolophura sinensis TaxID=3198878 RepID=UPI00315809EA